MIQVRKYDNGVWVGNGRKRVWVSSNMLDTYDQLFVSDDNPNIGEAVYTYNNPLIVGERYSGQTINQNVSDKMIVTNVAGNAYQYLKHFGGWCGFTTKDTRPELLDDCDYYLVWKGDQ